MRQASKLIDDRYRAAKSAVKWMVDGDDRRDVGGEVLMVMRRYGWEGGGFIYTYSVYLAVNVLLALGRDMVGMLLISEWGR
jgi:hypothetical protein